MWSQFTNVTDGRTDGQTTCDRNTALCTKVHCAVKTEFLTKCNVGSTSKIVIPCHSGAGILWFLQTILPFFRIQYGHLTGVQKWKYAFSELFLSVLCTEMYCLPNLCKKWTSLKCEHSERDHCTCMSTIATFLLIVESHYCVVKDKWHLRSHTSCFSCVCFVVVFNCIR